MERAVRTAFEGLSECFDCRDGTRYPEQPFHIKPCEKIDEQPMRGECDEMGLQYAWYGCDSDE